MIKHLCLVGSALLSVGLQAQVGINAGQKTDAPQYQEIAKDAVLQVANKQGEQKGVLLPSVSLNSTTDQSSITKDGASTVTKGLLVWCDGQGTDATKLAEGYYYWDGTQWVKIGGATAVSAPANTLYTSDGTISENRVIDIGNQTLKIKANNGKVEIGDRTTATGTNAFAVGYDTYAAGAFSTALGYQANATGLASTALGKFNVANENNLLSVGNGTSITARKNALVVDTNGNVAIGKDVADSNKDAAKLQVKGGITSEYDATRPTERQGVMFPLMTTAQRNQMSAPTEGLMIYNTTLHCQQIYNGNYWSCTDGSHITPLKNGKFYDGAKYVKDQKFGDGEHDFIYKVITGPDGKQWLNNNLGADYANMHSDVFNPDQQAKAKDDYHAYGSLFQWGRVDNTGYELVNWTSSRSGTHVRPNAPWKSDSQLTSYNDPCPSGYHTPTMSEWQDFHQAVTGSRTDVYNNRIWTDTDTKLNLTAAGYLIPSFSYQGDNGNYWSSTESSSNGARYLYFYNSYSNPQDDALRSVGFSVRCLKDE